MTHDPPLLQRSLHALGCDIELACGEADARRRLGRAASWLAAFEQRYSRFLSLSELSRLNAAAGRPFKASRGLFELVSLALDLAARSEGLFDPLILPQLLAAGYDRSFDEMPATLTHRPKPAQSRANWRLVAMDGGARSIRLPPGAAIDLGGIGKGWAVDRVGALLGTPSLVNAGGDVLLSGRPPGEESWLVGVAEPFRPEQDMTVLKAVDRGVATSSSLRRRWQRDGLVLHHLIDPRSGRPSESDAVQVTAIAPSALLADYHAKVALLKGVEAGLVYLERQAGVEGLVVRADGEVFASSGIEAYLPAEV
jgi:thiamine biosynthesis lipoprotein